MTCEKEIQIVKRAPSGKLIEKYHRRCNQPAAECVFGGALTTAKAILCDRHRAQAAKQAKLLSVAGKPVHE